MQDTRQKLAKYKLSTLQQRARKAGILDSDEDEIDSDEDEIDSDEDETLPRPQRTLVKALLAKEPSTIELAKADKALKDAQAHAKAPDRPEPVRYFPSLSLARSLSLSLARVRRGAVHT